MNSGGAVGSSPSSLRVLSASAPDHLLTLPPTTHRRAARGALPGAIVTQVVSVPNDPALRHVSFWLQAFQANGSLAHASPLAGGTIL